MLRYKLHTLSIKRIVYAPMMLIAVMFILYFNEIILSLLGWVPSGDLMMDPVGRNPSLIFGIKDLQSLSGIGNLLKILVPEFLTVHPVTGETFYWPVVWMIGPVFVYGSMIAFIFSLIYDKENTLAFVYDKLQNSREPLSEVTDINSHND